MHGHRNLQVGRKVGLRSYTNRVSGPYVVKRWIGHDVEIQCLKTGRRMTVAVDDITDPPRFK